MKLARFIGDRVCKEFWLLDADGGRHFPVRIKNRDTGRVAFNLSNSGNLKSAVIETDDIGAVADLVLNKGYSVRVVSEALPRKEGLSGLNKRKMVDYGRS